MDGADNRSVSDRRTEAMLNAVMKQRDQAANALVEQIGLTAQLQTEWQLRWSDADALKARLAELA